MKTLITAIALSLASLSALAQEATPAPEIDNFVATLTRAEVRMALHAAQARGELRRQDDTTSAPEQQRFVSTRSRAELRAEVLAAVARGERLSHGEASDEPPAGTAMASHGTARRQAMAAHEAARMR